MVEALLTTAAEGILRKAFTLAADEIVLAWGFKEDLTTLHDTLKTIQAVLQDAEKRQEKEARVKLWMERLKDVATKADDVLDQVQYEMLRRRVEIRNQMARKVSSFFSSSNPVAFRLKMGHKIKHINTKLAKIHTDARDFHLQPQVGDHPRQTTVHEQTDSLLDQFGVIGRDDEALKLVETLIGSSNEEKLAVIPIVGMGGLGKTTLAKLVYHNKEVEKHFDVRVWVCVSDNFDVEMLLTQILGFIMETKVEVQSKEKIIQELKKKLEGKKYLLVLDDVWNKNTTLWDNFQSCLLKVNEGSGNNILVTTRSEEVGYITKTSSFMHILNVLSDEQCSSILQRRAFAAGGPPVTPEFVDIANQIGGKCYGVPLVATVVGSILRTKENIDDWLLIQRSGVWELEGGDAVQNILKFGFDNLPNPLVKHCFAYCSIFQKDAVMDKEQLIELWMALGFVQEDGARNKDAEDVGEEFFKILAQSSLFQDFKKDYLGNITSCKMHDLVHDLAISLSRFETFNSEASTRGDIIPNVRHLAFYSSGEMTFTVLEEKATARYLRTLFLQACYVPEKLSLSFKCLRTLNLSNTSLRILSDSIGELVHLRYLDLSESKIEFLPRSMGKLYNLQTLRVSGCKSLKMFPKEVRNLINLRHFHFDRLSVDMPLEVGQLTYLRTLPSFVVGREKGIGIEELGSLNSLRGKLEVCNLEEVSSKEEGQRADLVGKVNLYGLVYMWRNGERKGKNMNDQEVLEGLQAPQDLKILEIINFLGDNFPKWVLKMAVSVNGERLRLQYLVDIRFDNCRRCEHVPMLGQLPHLQTLVLRDMGSVKCIDDSFYGGSNYNNSNTPISGGGGGGKPVVFPALRSFKIVDMEKLETWMDASAITGVTSCVVVFPCLEELCIERCGINLLPREAFRGARTSLKRLKIYTCRNLETIPTMQGFTSLEELIISDCSGLTSLASGLLGCCTSLAKLTISSCPELTSLPDLHDQSHSLEELTMLCCDRGNLPEGLSCLARLKELILGPFSEDLQSFKLILQGVFRHSKLSLRTLQFRGKPEWESIPEELQHLTALTSIILFNSGMEALPDWFGNFSSLEELHLFYCQKLKSLPSMETMGRLTKLNRILIWGCPLLKERVAEGSGPEWSKIAHIPNRIIECD